MKQPRGESHWLFWAFLVLLAVGAAGSSLWLPDVLRDLVPRVAASRWGLELTTGPVRVEWRRATLHLEDVRLATPPARLERVAISLDPLAPLAGRPLVEALTVSGGRWDPGAAEGAAGFPFPARLIRLAAGTRVEIENLVVGASIVDRLSLGPGARRGAEARLDLRARGWGGSVDAGGSLWLRGGAPEGALTVALASLDLAALPPDLAAALQVAAGRAGAEGSLRLLGSGPDRGAGPRLLWDGRVDVSGLAGRGPPELRAAGSWAGQGEISWQPEARRLDLHLDGRAAVESLQLRAGEAVRVVVEDGHWHGRARLAVDPAGWTAEALEGDLEAGRLRVAGAAAGRIDAERVTAWGLVTDAAGGAAAGRVRSARLTVAGPSGRWRGGPVVLREPGYDPARGLRAASAEAIALQHAAPGDTGWSTTLERVQADDLHWQGGQWRVGAVELAGVGRSRQGGGATSLRLEEAVFLTLAGDPRAGVVVERGHARGLSGSVALADPWLPQPLAGSQPASLPVPLSEARIGLWHLRGDNTLVLVDAAAESRPRLTLEGIQGRLSGARVAAGDLAGRFRLDAVAGRGGPIALQGELAAGSGFTATGRVEQLPLRPLLAPLLPLQGPGRLGARGTLAGGVAGTAQLAVRLQDLQADPGRLPGGRRLFALLADEVGAVQLEVRVAAGALTAPATWTAAFGEAARAAVLAFYGPLGADEEALRRLVADGRLPLVRVAGDAETALPRRLAERLLRRPRTGVELCGGASAQARQGLADRLAGLGLGRDRVVACGAPEQEPEDAAGAGGVLVSVVACLPPAGCGA